MVVVLVSEEHDDTPVFCREVLCDGVFSEWIRENECFVWGGNVADSEAHTGMVPVLSLYFIETHNSCKLIKLHTVSVRGVDSEYPWTRTTRTNDPPD